MKKETLDKIEKTVKNEGFIPVEVSFAQEAGRWTLKIFIHNPEKPVTLQDCEHITRELGDSLDEMISVPYSLEVSSPGTERKLKSEREYEIFRGERIKVKLKNKEIFVTELNDEFLKAYKKEDIAYIKLEPEYKL